MKILVVGGTGMVGSHVVRELASRQQEIYVLTRNADKAKALPSGVKARVGNLIEADTVRELFRGMEAVFLINTVSPAEAHEGLLAVNAARLEGARRIVYVSVHRVRDAPHLPHFGSKIAVELAIEASGIPYTILRPNNFYQNDLWLKDVILQYGAYPQPLGDIGCSRVDVRDIAEAAAIALTTKKSESGYYNLVGPEALTGPATAEHWSRALGQAVKYAGNDLEAWEVQSRLHMPSWLVFDFKLMYEFFQKEGFRATPEDHERQKRLLGHPPRRFEDFAKEMAAAWKS